jgi:hypothetical protein
VTIVTPAPAIVLLKEFEGPWRDGTPVFGCCRKTVAAATEDLDLLAIAGLDATARVRVLREAVERRYAGHLSTHRCCVGHLADLAFDLPDLLMPSCGC